LQETVPTRLCHWSCICAIIASKQIESWPAETDNRTEIWLVKKHLSLKRTVMQLINSTLLSLLFIIHKEIECGKLRDTPPLDQKRVEIR
jgi:hypothetical protein